MLDKMKLLRFLRKSNSDSSFSAMELSSPNSSGKIVVRGNSPKGASSSLRSRLSPRSHSTPASPSGSAHGRYSPSMASSSRKSGLRPKQIKELEEVFRYFDADGDGKISVAELGSVLRSLGDDITEEELQLMVKEVDKNGDGVIDLKEFIEINNVETDLTEKGVTDELRQAFHIFDIDRNGYITPEELHKVMLGLGEKLTVEQCGNMIQGVDRNGDGFVDFEEFKKMMTSTCS